jgi:hypothetical protein
MEPLAAKVENPLFNPVFFLANKEEKKNLVDAKKAAVQLTKSIVTINHLPATNVVTREENLVVREANAPAGIRSASELKFGDYFRNESSFDTIDVAVQKVLNKSLAVDWKKIEQDIEKASREIEANKLKLFFDSKEVKAQLRIAFEQLKKLDIQNKQIHTNALAKQEVRKAAAIKPADNKTNRRIAILIETEEAKKQLHELEQQQIILTHLPDEPNLSLAVPGTLYSPVGRESRTSSCNFNSRQVPNSDCNAALKVRAEAMKRRTLGEHEKAEAEADSTEQRKACEKPMVKKLKTVRI